MIVTQKTKLVPPDGGWGWVVLISALTVNLLIPGTMKSFGVLFVEFMEVFKTSPTAASWIPALCYFLYSALGPLSSILSNKYSYKTITIIGGSFAAVGMMLSYFANSVAYLYISYGIMVGIGAGLTYPITIYIVTAYFVKYRGLASGLCVSGSAIGSIILPPFLQYLLDQFGYRGAVLILGAIMMNTAICGFFFHPVEEHMKEVSPPEGFDNNALTIDEPAKPHEVTCEVKNETNGIIVHQNSDSFNEDTTEPEKNESERVVNGTKCPNGSCGRYKENLVMVSQRQSTKIERKEPKESKSSDSKTFDLSVLKDPVYLIILISNSTSAISNTNFMILLPTYAIEEGFNKTMSAVLISIVSTLDLVGRIGGASLSDIDFIPKYYYFIGGLGTSGIALALLPMASSYGMLSFFCALFGLSSGIYIGITTVILTDLLGTEKLSSSYGISLFVNGMLQLVGPPICGAIFEKIGSYKPIFLAFGIILILGTALWGLMPLTQRKKNKELQSA